jgi:hypothetical protein
VDIERIHVGAQSDAALPRALALEGSYDTGSADVSDDIKAPASQLLGDDAGGALLLEAGFRMGV